jgi:RNA polymerase sigma factor (sigma-70 family)
MHDRRADSTSSQIESLFRLGVVTGLSDGQLLERFTARSDEAGQIAFEAIVRRHGPMVLGVCRRVLGHEQAAEDAFQATFMVLALKAPAVRSGESLGPWLHSVAVRVARRALATSRRDQPEGLPAQEPVDTRKEDPDLAELAAVIDEEVRRLPDRYRLPVVLCYMEGQTQEEAARTLGWTKGTVSGRLARAKDLLRHRLTRRGLAPTAGIVGAALATETASAAVPVSLLVATGRAAAAAILGGAEAGLVAGSVSSLARAALKWMVLARVVRAAAQCLVLGITAAAVGATLLTTGGPDAGGPAAPRPQAVTRALRVDRFGDVLPPGVLTRLGTVQRRHTARVVGIDFTRDGQLLSVQGDGVARFWDDQTGRQVRVESVVENGPVDNRIDSRFVLSPDGRFLAASGFASEGVRPRGPHPVWIWELEPHRLWRQLEVETIAIYALAFSPDGATLATGGFGGDVQLWDVDKGTRRSAFKVGNFPVYALAFAPDGRSLVATTQGQPVVVWDLQENRGTNLPGLMGSMASSLRFSPDGQLLAVPEFRGQIVLWDRILGRERVRVPGMRSAFAPDSRRLAVAGTGDGMLSVFDTQLGLARWKAEIGWGMMTTPPAFSPDGQTVVNEQDGVLRFFDAGSGRERFGEDDVHQGKMSAVRFSPDGRQVIAAEFGGPIRVWDPVSARPLREIRQHTRVALIAVSPDGRSVATAEWNLRGSLAVWDLDSGKLRTRWTATGQHDQVKAVAFSSDGETVLMYLDSRQLKVLQIATGRERSVIQPRFQLTEHPQVGVMMTGSAFSPGNRFLAVRAAQTVHVADLATGEERFVRPCWMMAFSADGTTLAIAHPPRPVVKDLGSGKVPFSTLNSEAIELLDVDSGMIRRIEIPPEIVRALAFSPDASVLAVAVGTRQPMIRLYRTNDGREVQSFPLPAAVSHDGDLAFSPDGRTLAAGLDDTTIPIWDVTNLH